MEILFISCVTIWSVFQNPVTFMLLHKTRAMPTMHALHIYAPPLFPHKRLHIHNSLLVQEVVFLIIICSLLAVNYNYIWIYGLYTVSSGTFA